jgi:hypothetical protein
MKYILKLIFLTLLSVSIFSISYPDMIKVEPKLFNINWNKNGDLSCEHGGVTYENVVRVHMSIAEKANELKDLKVVLSVINESGRWKEEVFIRPSMLKSDVWDLLESNNQLLKEFHTRFWAVIGFSWSFTAYKAVKLFTQTPKGQSQEETLMWNKNDQEYKLVSERGVVEFEVGKFNRHGFVDGESKKMFPENEYELFEKLYKLNKPVYEVKPKTANPIRGTPEDPEIEYPEAGFSLKLTKSEQIAEVLSKSLSEGDPKHKREEQSHITFNVEERSHLPEGTKTVTIAWNADKSDFDFFAYYSNNESKELKGVYEIKIVYSDSEPRYIVSLRTTLGLSYLFRGTSNKDTLDTLKNYFSGRWADVSRSRSLDFIKGVKIRKTSDDVQVIVRNSKTNTYELFDLDGSEPRKISVDVIREKLIVINKESYTYFEANIGFEKFNTLDEFNNDKIDEANKNSKRKFRK